MEQQIFSKFNIYDQIGYLMVGSIGIMVILFDANHFYYKIPPALNIGTFIVWFILAYFLGHLVQAISNLLSKIPFIKFLVRENKSDFDTEQKEVLQKIKNDCDLKAQSDSKIWNIGYLYSLSKDTTGQIQAFNAYYSMYRGWLVVFFIQSIGLIYVCLDTKFGLLNIFLIIASTSLTGIFYIRSKRFWNYLTNKVLQMYLVVKV